MRSPLGFKAIVFFFFCDGFNNYVLLSSGLSDLIAQVRIDHRCAYGHKIGLQTNRLVADRATEVPALERVTARRGL